MYLGLDLISELEAVEIGDGALHRLMLLGSLRGRARSDASVPPVPDFHSSGEARRLLNLDLVAPHFMHRTLHLISELGAIEFGHGALHKPSRIVGAIDHESHALGLVVGSWAVPRLAGSRPAAPRVLPGGAGSVHDCPHALALVAVHVVRRRRILHAGLPLNVPRRLFQRSQRHLDLERAVEMLLYPVRQSQLVECA